MIKLLDEGEYKLSETEGEIKILTLNGGTYAWVDLEGIGEMLVTSQKQHHADTVLSVGRYKLYDVDKERGISEQQHLELSVGEQTWQGYLLPTGLPVAEKIRSRIVPTKEVITSRKTA